MSLHDEIDISRIDLDAAYRAARERGMAERARVARELARAAVAGVRRLFTAPEATGNPCEAC
ncbi:hypothetical protein M1105_11490 [Limibaculum sp. FT325]|uniref:hypothetical protein n=1 Tax=Thermohalobaculum sediminis TaxID=2939436 RepID=UPI0020BF6ACB|nr:hypothetical protein [Limibaculum sediminis]MCL5777605.1 hypothetical protein [Limibaculum sediminis]